MIGLIAAVGLSDFGNTVIGVDLNEDKINLLKQRISPIYELGVEDYLNRNLGFGCLSFTTDMADAIQDSQVIFIAVCTPEKANEEAELSSVEAVVNTIAKNLKSYKVVVTKSTFLVGPNRWIKNLLTEKTSENNFDVVQPRSSFVKDVQPKISFALIVQ